MIRDSEPEWSGPVLEADVYKAGKLLGKLTRSPAGVVFNYLDQYLNAATGTWDAVATTLPLSDQPVISPAGAVPPFFAGLLPEGRRLSALRRKIKASADDELSLLVAVGLDTVGDIQVVRAGSELNEVRISKPELLDPKSISFAELLSEELPLDGVGLPGVQEKVSGRTIAVPVNHKNQETILKLSPPEYPSLVENEAFFLALAKRAGLSTVDYSVIHDRDGVSGLVIGRFDRVRETEGSGSVLRRIPVEDGCQVLGLWPADKYTTTTRRLIEALTELCSANLVATRAAFEQIVFAILTGNGDLHSKNMSIVQKDQEWVLAPAYDLPSTLFYGDKTLALPIDGKVSDISRRQLLEFAQSLGLSSKTAERVLDNLLDATTDLEADLRSGAVPIDPLRISDAVSAIRYRRRLLTNQ